LRVEGDALRLVWVSENVTQMVGFSPEEAYSPAWWLNNVHPSDAARVSLALRHSVTKEQSSDEFRFCKKNGDICWIRDERRVQRDADGLPTEIIGSWADVTERRLLEEQLRQAMKMEAIGQLAGGVAHDFNNILTVILGYTDLLIGELELDDPRRNYCMVVRDAGKHAATLTQRLLAFGRKQMLHPECININTVVTDLERMLPRLIGEDIQVHSVLDPDLRSVLVDRGQLEQIILNLSVNARDAMPEGGNLSIETSNAELDEEYTHIHPEVSPGPYVLLAITDSGMGMSPEVLGRIYEPFFTTKEPGKGTGLGLATMYGIVKQSNGHISVYSEEGHGSVFKVYLPPINADTQNTVRSAPADHGICGTETILVTEDDDALRELARRILERGGFTVLLARSGDEALHIAEAYKRPIHLLFTDVVMPGMNGVELAQILSIERPKMRCLFASGHTAGTISRYGVLDAPESFLQKPFTPHSLLSKVREALDRPE